VTYCILFALLSLTGCKRVDDTCYIRVGDICIEREDFRVRLERFAEESLITSSEVLESMKPMIVDTLIEELLILNYALDNRITITEAEVNVAVEGFLDGMKRQDFDHVLTEGCRDISDIRDFIRRRAIISKAVDKTVRSGLAVSEEDTRSYYDQNTSEFYHPLSVELYHVFVKDHSQAKEALTLLRSGIPLTQVVSTYDESARDELGFMGVFTKGELPKEVEDVVFSIPQRRYSHIIETQRGYHIFFVAQRTEARTRSYEEVADELRERLTEQLFETRYAQWLRELKTNYSIEVNWDEITTLSVHG